MEPSVSEKYIVDKKGNPTAVILPIKDYKKMLFILEEAENQKETKILSESPEFRRLIKKGLDDVNSGKTRPWKEVWNEL